MQEFATSQDKSLVRKVAYQILSHFDKSYRWFTRITRGAQERFEKGKSLLYQVNFKAGY